MMMVADFLTYVKRSNAKPMQKLVEKTWFLFGYILNTTQLSN